MPCYNPQIAYFPRAGGRPVFREPIGDGESYRVGQIPCNQCIGCLERKARNWAIRVTHEAQLHKRKCFITLTYSDRYLPWKGVSRRDVQLFLKRLRKHFGVAGLRYFGCAEYGTRTKRGHYHLVLFGVDFYEDREPAGKSAKGMPMYSSKLLERLWGMGICTVQEVTPETCAYTARYCMSKSLGGGAPSRIHPKTGKVVSMNAEFMMMSRRPGIAREWFEKFGKGVTDFDAVVGRGGAKTVPPEFYDRLVRERSEAEYQALKAMRKAKAMSSYQISESQMVRLAVREEVHLAKAKQSLRSAV